MSRVPLVLGEETNVVVEAGMVQFVLNFEAETRLANIKERGRGRNLCEILDRVCWF